MTRPLAGATPHKPDAPARDDAVPVLGVSRAWEREELRSLCAGSSSGEICSGIHGGGRPPPCTSEQISPFATLALSIPSLPLHLRDSALPVPSSPWVTPTCLLERIA